MAVPYGPTLVQLVFFFVVGFHLFVVVFHLPQGVEQQLHAFQFGSKCEPQISQSAKLLPIMFVRRRFGQSLAVQRMFAALFRVPGMANPIPHKDGGKLPEKSLLTPSTRFCSERDLGGSAPR